jgi:hypothetical protein
MPSARTTTEETAMFRTSRTRPSRQAQEPQQTYSRRDLLRRGATLLGGLTLAAVPLGAIAAGGSQRTRTWYALQTTRDDADRACTRHAANKLFADPVAADLHRAHPGCNCQIVHGGELPERVWVNLFGDPSNVARPQVDRRWAWVGKALA